MFGGLVNQAQTAVNQTVNRVIGQAAVALPLLVATGFLTTAGMIELIAIFGAVKACLIAASIFLVIALITAAFTTSTIADVEALVSGEATKAEQEQIAAGDPTEDIAKLITSDPMMALSAATTGFGVIKTFSRRTQVTIAVTAILLVLTFLYLARRKPSGTPGNENSKPDESKPSAAEQVLAAAA